MSDPTWVAVQAARLRGEGEQSLEIVQRAPGELLMVLRDGETILAKRVVPYERLTGAIFPRL